MDNKDSQQDENEVWLPTPQLQEEREDHLTTGTKISPELKSEPFSVQKNTFVKGLALLSMDVPLFEFEVSKRNQSDLRHKQEKRSLSTTRERVTKRHRPEEAAQEETNELSHDSNLFTSQTVKDYNYMCPLDSDEATDSENDDDRDDLQKPTTSDIHSDPESSCVGTQETFFPTTDDSSCLPTLTSQLDQSGLCGGKEKAEVPRPCLYVPYKYDMEEEEMETESNMWKLRANRVQQILFSLDNEYCTFSISKHFGLEYNVGFGPKQNFNVYSSSNSMLLEIAKFAVAMNSSQEDFIMEILEYNFDFGYWSEDQRKSFTSKLMNRLRWLKKCEDTVKLSKESFELPALGSSVNMASQSMGSVKPEIGSTSRTIECDVAPTCSQKEHRVGIYPFCQDIGLKLNVISSQEHKKLDIYKLTNGAMTEVTNFAEKLCGTFDQICLDILRHNFDLDSDLARTILTQIPVIMEHNRLSSCIFTYKNKYTLKDISATAMGCQKKINFDNTLTGSKEIKNTVSKVPITSQNVGSSTDNEIDNETNLLFWKLRQTQIRQILTVPHGEHCPFYAYSRCKKLGIDFNVGSGVKQKFDPSKFLTHGIMLEMTTLGAALDSAQKEFITEILEYNFDLNLNNEVCRSVFAQCVLEKIRTHALKYKKMRILNMPFELPDPSSVDQSTYPKGKYCPKCNQDRNSNLFQDQDHAMTDTVFAETNCSAQKPTKDLSLVFHAAEEKIMNSNPHCKKIGLSLCADKDKPKRKLDLCVLTRGVMREIALFAKRLCGTKYKVINDVLEHNFNFGNFQHQYFNHASQFHHKVILRNNKGPTWFNDIFVISPWPYRVPADFVKQTDRCTAEKNKKRATTKTQTLALHTKNEERSEKDLLVMKKDCQNNPNLDTCSTDFSQAPNKSQTVGSFTNIEQGNELDSLLGTKDATELKEDSAIQKNERKEMTKKRKLALLTKKEEAAMLSKYTGAVKAKKCKQSNGDNYPICKGIVLDLDSENPTSTDIHSESEPSCLGNRQPFLTAPDGSSSLPIVDSNVNPSCVSQPDERRLFGTEEKTEIQQNVPYKYDMEDEEMETESHMWKLRVNRVQQILLSLDNEYCTFKRSRRLGLEYNVGFGPKQKFSVDSLNKSTLFEIVKFSLAMNSSQADFLMEILEYNFNFGHWSEDQRKRFASELMDRVRWLKNCEDAVRLSKEVFELPDFVSSVNMSNHSMGSVKLEFSCMSRTLECDVAPTCSSDPQAETKEHKVDLYPFCKDIGLKLNVISSQENKKLDINKLTNGAMTEVTNFAEKLCGTFDQICLEILRHNFDLDQPKGDFDLARTILAQIPILLEQTRLATFMKKYAMADVSGMAIGCQKNPDLDAHNLLNLTSSKEIKHTIKELPAMQKDCQNNSNLDTCSTGFSQAPITSQNVGSSTDINQDNEPDLFLWTLRETQIRQILSVPHVERCPFYSYPRCSKLGIDFNVASGVKQKFDPSEFLTNGIMLELNTFAEALKSSHREFITEILEYNFDLNLTNEACRSVFTQRVFDKAKSVVHCSKKLSYLNMPFELPDTSSVDQSTHPKGIYCPKCYQDRNSKLFQDPSDPVNELHHHPHSMTDTVFAERNCSAQKPAKDLSLVFQAAEENIMSSYPLCKKIGLSLCVDKDKPRRKLDLCVLTRGVVHEVFHFAKKLCGRKNQLMRDVLEHNFNIQCQDLNPVELLHRMALLNNGLTWFNDIFVIQPYPNRGPRYKGKEDSAMQKNERKETTQKRKLALLSKKEEAATLTDFSGAVKGRTRKLASAEIFPLCSKIGLDLDVTSKSGKKEKLDLKLLTTGVVAEIYKFLLKKPKHYYPGTLYDILDYNFDISSQNYRRWEFSIAAASQVKLVATTYRKNLHGANEVFKLPFVFKKKASNGSGKERRNHKTAKLYVEKAEMTKNGEVRASQRLKRRSDVSHACLVDVQTNMEVEDGAYVGSKKTGKSHQEKNAVRQLRSHSAVSHAHFREVKTYKEQWMNKGKESPKHPGTTMQMTMSPGRSVCDSPLQEDLQIKEDGDDSHYGVVKPEPVTSPEADMTTKAAQQLKCSSDVSHACLVDVQTKTEVCFHEEDIKSETYPETIKQQTGSPMSAGCDGPLHENIQIKEDEYDSYHVAVKPEPVTEEISEPIGSFGYNLITICPLSGSNIKTESETDEAQYYSLTRPQVSEGCGILAVCPNSESNVKTEPDTEDVKYEIPLESVGSQAFCSITTHQDTDSTSVKTEQENVPVVSNHYDVVCVKQN